MLKIEQINPYDSSNWKQKFSILFPDIAKDYDHIIYTYKEMNVLKAALHHTVYEKPSVVLEKYDILNATPYYYLQWILEKNPDIVVDIGCNHNPFKKLIPNIIGIDDGSCADTNAKDYLKMHFNEEFASMHQSMCDAVVSINTIHFSPIWTIKSKLLALSQLVRNGGRAFVSFNAETWLMSTSKDEIENYFGRFPNFECMLEYIYLQVKDTKLNFLVSDWPICHVTEHSPIRDDLNGNIRLVFEVDNQIPQSVHVESIVAN